MHTDYRIRARPYYSRPLAAAAAAHTFKSNKCEQKRMNERRPKREKKMIRVYIIYGGECVRCQNGFYTGTRCRYMPPCHGFPSLAIPNTVSAFGSCEHFGWPSRACLPIFFCFCYLVGVLPLSMQFEQSYSEGRKNI